MVASHCTSMVGLTSSASRRVSLVGQATSLHLPRRIELGDLRQPRRTTSGIASRKPEHDCFRAHRPWSGSSCRPRKGPFRCYKSSSFASLSIDNYRERTGALETGTIDLGSPQVCDVPIHLSRYVDVLIGYKLDYQSMSGCVAMDSLTYSSEEDTNCELSF